jgi:protein-tyrosine phosphatase
MMIDLHTHLLPDWDDGAADIAEAERMIELAREDGISQIALTPHVFRATKHGTDGRGLKTRIRTFIKKSKPFEVVLYPGAEVHVHPEMIAQIKACDLTVNGSNFVFIEFPADHVPGGATNLIYQMMLEGLIPIISHPERNAELARSPEVLYELIKQGAIAQITSMSLTGGFGPQVRAAAENFLRHGLGHLIASDAHNATTRPPRLAEAVELTALIVGSKKAEAMVTTVPAAILKNEEIPDLGDPVYPAKKNRRLFSFR